MKPGIHRASLSPTIDGLLAHLKLDTVAAVVTGAVAALGAGKTLYEVVSGESLGLQEVAYYLGEAAFIVYGGILGGILASAIGAIPLLLLLFLVGLVLDEKHSRAMELTAGALSGALALAGGLGVMWYLATQPSAFDYEQEAALGRGLTAVAGVAVLGGGVYLWRHLRQSAGVDSRRRSR